MRYQDARPHLKTGDLLLFHGVGPLSRVVKLFTQDETTHVGMVYKRDTMLFIWESTSFLKGIHGVQMSLLSNRIRAYRGEIYLRELLGNHVFRLDKLEKFRREVKDRPYESSIIELAAAALPFRVEGSLDSLFCSEIISEAYMRMGLLDDSKPSNEYTPADFNTLELIPPATLGEKKILTYP